MRHDPREQQVSPPSVGGHPRSVAGGSSASAVASLGIYAKNSSAPSGTHGIDPETGEVFNLRTDGKGRVSIQKSPEQSRWERWALKSVANKLLPNSRTSKCMRWRRPKQDIQLLRGTETGKAYYHGLQVCASVWACPVCAAKITERRRAELVSAVASAKAMGLGVYLVTLTVPHGLGDDVNAILDNMQKAMRKLSSDRAGRKFIDSIELAGTIRALEVTHGENGFHPHYHVLYFVPASITARQIESGLSPLWQTACVAVGLPRPSVAHGCRVEDGSRAAAYCSKWGIESEMTKGHTKTSKTKEGRSMWDLLRSVLADKSDKQSAALFRVYAEAFKGRRQLHWSVGLRKLLAVVEKSDDEVANEQAEDPAIVLADFTDDEWRHVYKSRSESLILDLAEKQPEAIHDFLKRLFAPEAGAAAGGARDTRRRHPPTGRNPSALAL